MTQLGPAFSLATKTEPRALTEDPQCGTKARQGLAYPGQDAFSTAMDNALGKEKETLAGPAMPMGQPTPTPNPTVPTRGLPDAAENKPTTTGNDAEESALPRRGTDPDSGRHPSLSNNANPEAPQKPNATAPNPAPVVSSAEKGSELPNRPPVDTAAVAQVVPATVSVQKDGVGRAENPSATASGSVQVDRRASTEKGAEEERSSSPPTRSVSPQGILDDCTAEVLQDSTFVWLTDRSGVGVSETVAQASPPAKDVNASQPEVVVSQGTARSELGSNEARERVSPPATDSASSMGPKGPVTEVGHSSAGREIVTQATTPVSARSGGAIPGTFSRAVVVDAGPEADSSSRASMPRTGSEPGLPNPASKQTGLSHPTSRAVTSAPPLEPILTPTASKPLPSTGEEAANASDAVAGANTKEQGERRRISHGIDVRRPGTQSLDGGRAEPQPGERMGLRSATPEMGRPVTAHAHVPVGEGFRSELEDSGKLASKSPDMVPDLAATTSTNRSGRVEISSLAALRSMGLAAPLPAPNAALADGGVGGTLKSQVTPVGTGLSAEVSPKTVNADLAGLEPRLERPVQANHESWKELAQTATRKPNEPAPPITSRPIDAAPAANQDRSTSVGHSPKTRGESASVVTGVSRSNPQQTSGTPPAGLTDPQPRMGEKLQLSEPKPEDKGVSTEAKDRSEVRTPLVPSGKEAKTAAPMEGRIVEPRSLYRSRHEVIMPSQFVDAKRAWANAFRKAGTASAEQVDRMKNRANEEYSAARKGQESPARTAFTPAATGRPGEVGMPTGGAVKIEPGTHADRKAEIYDWLIHEMRAESTPGSQSVSRVQGGGGAAVDRVERLQELVSREVVLGRKLGADSLTVMLRPDPGTELHLRLQTHQGHLEAHIRCERGDMSALSAHWEQLREALAEMQVRLQPLKESPWSQSHASGTPGESTWLRDESGASERNEEDEPGGAGQSFFDDEPDVPSNLVTVVPDYISPKPLGWEFWA